MLTEISLGYRLFSIAKLLHQSVFLNGTMVNMESWPNFTKARLEIFEKIEQHYFRTVLSGHSKVPIEAIYLTVGVPPFRFQLMKRRISYYRLILLRDNGELTKKIVNEQKRKPLKGDFYPQVKEDLDYLLLTETDLTCRNTDSFKSYLSSKIDEAALKYLLEKAENHSKVRQELYNNLNGLEYLFDPRFSPDLSKLVFSLQTRSYNVRNNFRNQYQNQNINCSLCEVELDEHSHIFNCDVIRKVTGNLTSQYEDLFSQDIDKLYEAAKTAKMLDETRKLLLDP